MKPTHMIGGYAQLDYGFNYYGTVGANRDELVVVRKMSEVNWFDKAADDAANVTGGTADWGTGAKKESAEGRLAHRTPWCSTSTSELGDTPARSPASKSVTNVKRGRAQACTTSLKDTRV